MDDRRRSTLLSVPYDGEMATLLLAHPMFLARSPDEQAASSPYFPLGILYLASWVRENGHEVAIYDGTFESGPETFVDALAAHNPDVVGISALLPTREHALTLARMAAASGTAVVIGGPDPTLDPAPYLAEGAVDVVVHHEGEQTITRLLELADANALTIESLVDEPGVAFRSAGTIEINQPRQPIENLDELPLPARDLVDMDRYLHLWETTNGYSSMTISTSRGCPYSCTWCQDAVHGTNFRQRSPESVAAEIESLKADYTIERLRLVDDVDAIERSWFDQWAKDVVARNSAIPFEALNDLQRQDLPLLDVRDSL